MFKNVRVDVALAFALVMFVAAVSFFPLTALGAIGVSLLTLNRWGAPQGHKLGVRLAFVSALWVSGGVCGSMVRTALVSDIDLALRLFTGVLVFGLSAYALRYLSRRVNAWWPTAAAT